MPSVSAGTHAVKNRADIHRTGKKMYRQKGTGSARHGSARVNLFRGGGRSFGPLARSHEIGLPKKVRALALGTRCRPRPKTAASSSSRRSSLKDAKTKALRDQLREARPGERADHRRRRGRRQVRPAARNIPNIDVLPIQGINVYDILRRHKLVLTRAAVDALEARFK